jgi:predicted transcriptional regulator of viral defense system
MDIYEKVAKQPTFTVANVLSYYTNMESARSAVKRLVTQGRAQKIRNNLYTCISPEHGGPIANRYQIASAITPSSYVSHHSAMTYHGISNQVSYEVIVSSSTRFRDFEFDGYFYRYVQSRLSEGIVTYPYSGGVKVTDIERSIADCLKDMDRFSGLEEIKELITSVRTINETKLIHYLTLYNNQFLFQKAGFMLWDCRDNMGLSDNFFSACEAKIGKSKRYLTKDSGEVQFNNKWKLVVPQSIITTRLEEETDASI